MTDRTTYSFDGWTLRAGTGELTREGKTQRLTQQPLRILLELLDHPAEVVTRERLVELLWPKDVVDYDNGLNVAVRKLRMTLVMTRKCCATSRPCRASVTVSSG